MSLTEEMIRLDIAMHELEERLKTDQKFGEQFYKELEEIKKIQIPLEDVETEGLYKRRQTWRLSLEN